MARDYKGIGNQEMTAAMMCFSPTNEAEQKTEECQTENRKER